MYVAAIIAIFRNTARWYHKMQIAKRILPLPAEYVKRDKERRIEGKRTRNVFSTGSVVEKSHFPKSSKQLVIAKE